MQELITNNVHLIKGDCIEVMRNIPDKSVDMILCDLPYGTTRNKWDTIIPLDKLWEQYTRIIKDNGAIVLFAQTPFDKVLGSSNLKMLRYEWIWEKEQATGFLNAKKMPLKVHENILIFYKKLPIYNPQWGWGKPYKCAPNVFSSNYGSQRHNVTISDGRRYPKDIIKIKRKGTDRHLHPTQKPVELLKYLIKTYTNDGETILDNCMGCGSTGQAVLEAGGNRKFIGIEINDNYFDIAYNRINGYIQDNCM